MTCIIGIVSGKRVIMGADSAGVAGLDITIRNDAKLFHVGDFLIGGAGSFRMIQLLRYSFRPPAIETDDLYEYMCTAFIEAVRQTFVQHGYAEVNNNVNSSDGMFLVGYGGRLFEIETDFQVGENAHGISCIGCGSDYALGALAAMPASMNAKTKVKRALEISTHFSGGVRPPFLIAST